MFKPKYQITNPILNNLLEIAEVRYLVNHTSILPKEEIRLRREALVRMIHSSTSIEGNVLNRYEVDKVLKGKKIDVPKRDRFEVENYRDALYYIGKLQADKKKITTKTILEIHRLVTKRTIDLDKCGAFRKDKVYVVQRKGRKITKIIYQGPEAKQVPKLVDNLVKWLQKSKKEKICPVIVAALAHYQIASIHPFADGNGRTARALATLILWQRDYDFKKLFVLEDYYNKNRSAYYQAIHTGSKYDERQEADLTNWINYFVKGFKVSEEEVKEKLIPLSLDEKLRRKIGQVYLDKRQIKIVDFIVTMGKITSEDVIDILDIAKRTAQLYLQSLSKLKVIRKEGKGPKSYYILNI